MSKPNEPRLWIKLTVPGIGQVGPGKIELLRLIDREMSIAAAARCMNMSYRRAWLLVDELNRMFPTPIVETSVGGNSRGGARLTALGLKLVDTYARALDRSNESCADLLAELTREAQASSSR